MSRADGAHVAPVRAPAQADEALRAVLQTAGRALEDSTVFVAVLDPGRQSFLVVDTIGSGGCDIRAGQEEALKESFCMHMVTGRAPELCNDAAGHDVYGRLRVQSDCDIGSYIGIPIELSEGRTVGTFCAVAKKSNRYDEADVQTVRLAAQLVAQDLEHRWGRLELQGIVDSLRKQALIDPLTGLANRPAFEQALEREWLLVKREQRCDGYVVVADLDSLKAINDRQGHAAGDEVIIEAGRALAGAARRSDLVARLGGDEFAALLPGCSSNEAAQAFCDRARDSGGDGGAARRLSLGFCVLSHAESTSAAMDRADALMYRDKRRRR